MSRKIIVLFLGVLFGVLSLEIATRAIGGAFIAVQNRWNRVRLGRKADVRILCLGESSTAGQYPRYLEEIINRKSGKKKYIIFDYGRVGSCSRDTVRSLHASLDRVKPDMVITMLGIHDVGDSYRAMTVLNDPRKGNRVFIKNCRLYRLVYFLYDALREKNDERFYSEINDTSDDYLGIFSPPSGGSDTAQALPALIRDTVSSGRMREAEQMCRAAMALPMTAKVAVEVSGYYQVQGQYADGEKVLRKALETNPGNEDIAVQLGKVLAAQGKGDEEVSLYRNIITLFPGNTHAYFLLGLALVHQKKFTEAEESFTKATNINFVPDKVFGALAVNYMRQKKYWIADKYFAKAEELRLSLVSPETLQNYRAVYEELNKRNIQLVCMQYPMRGIAPLKKMFRHRKNIIFIDNDEIFKDAVRKKGYDAYFKDDYGGDFGHCKPEGNILIAENVADTIVEHLN